MDMHSDKWKDEFVEKQMVISVYVRAGQPVVTLTLLSFVCRIDSCDFESQSCACLLS